MQINDLVRHFSDFFLVLHFQAPRSGPSWSKCCFSLLLNYLGSSISGRHFPPPSPSLVVHIVFGHELSLVQYLADEQKVLRIYK